MKKLAVFLLTLTILLSALMNAANGQTQMPRKPNHHKYVHLIKLMYGVQKAGWIIMMDSLQIELLDRDRPEHIQKIDQREIKSISIHRKGAGGRGFLVGAFIGGLLGGIIGAASYPPPPTPATFSGAFQSFEVVGATIGGALAGILGGGLIGGIIGSNTHVRKFEINGDSVEFERARAAFQERTFIR